MIKLKVDYFVAIECCKILVIFKTRCYKPYFAHFITRYKTQIKYSVTYTLTGRNTEDTCTFTKN